MKKTHLLALAFAAAAVLLVGCDRREPAGQNPPTDTPSADQAPTAPDFTLTDQAGRTHTLSDYRGSVVVLEWFNPECPFVIRHYEAGTMANLADAYADRDVIWLTINTTSHFNHEMNQAAVQQYNLPYPVLDDSDGTVGRRYGAETTPHMFVIDTAGHIAYTGAIDDDPVGNKSVRVNYVEKALDDLLAGRPVATSETRPYGCSVKYADL